jgi:hypothetical protein
MYDLDVQQTHLSLCSVNLKGKILGRCQSSQRQLTKESEAECSCLAQTLGVTKLIIVTDMIWVTLCCATYVRLRCSTNPPQFVFCQFKRRTFWVNACRSSRRQLIGESEACSLNKGSCLAPPALGVTGF